MGKLDAVCGWIKDHKVESCIGGFMILGGVNSLCWWVRGKIEENERQQQRERQRAVVEKQNREIGKMLDQMTKTVCSNFENPHKK